MQSCIRRYSKSACFKYQMVQTLILSYVLSTGLQPHKRYHLSIVTQVSHVSHMPIGNKEKYWDVKKMDVRKI